MEIIIVAHYFSHKGNDRFAYLANMLSEKDDIEIITTDFSHSKKVYKTDHYDNSKYVVSELHEIGYKKNISFKRIISHALWGLNVKKYLKNKKPDVVYCAVPSLTGSLFTAKYCKNKGIRFIVDIQDLWPEAFQMVFPFKVLGRLLFLPFKIMANSIYKRADSVCSVSESYTKRGLAVNKSAHGCTVFLGTDLKTFDSFSTSEIEIKKNGNEVWIGYCGSISESYDLGCILSALEVVQNKGISNYRFIVMGDGDKRERYENLAKSKRINALFLGMLDYDKMCAVLAKCDFAVNPIKKGSAASIINKHADYVAASQPVINTQESPEYQSLVEKYNMGFNCDGDDIEGISEKILLLMNDADLRQRMSKNARKCAEELFDRGYTYKRLIREIKNEKNYY